METFKALRPSFTAALRHVARELALRRSVEALAERPGGLQGELMAIALEVATEAKQRRERPLELGEALKVDLWGAEDMPKSW